jgi:hypothetical protein
MRINVIEATVFLLHVQQAFDQQPVLQYISVVAGMVIVLVT